MKIATQIDKLVALTKPPFRAVSPRSTFKLAHDAILAHCMQRAIEELRTHATGFVGWQETVRWLHERTAELARGFGLIED